MYSNEAIILVLVLSLIFYIMSKFIKGKLFDAFASKNTGIFNIGSALMMGFVVNMAVGLVIVIIGWLINIGK